MNTYWPRLYEVEHVDGFDVFVGGRVVVDMFELLRGSVGDVSIVLACFLGVDEGVDLWFSCGSLDRPRLRIHFSAGDVEREASFVVYDDVVRKMAPLACNLLLGMDGGGSFYPVELEESFGDAMFLKVRRVVSLDSCSPASYEVLDVFSHPSLLNVYLSPCCTSRADDCLVCPSPRVPLPCAPKNISSCVGGSSSGSSSGGEDGFDDVCAFLSSSPDSDEGLCVSLSKRQRIV